MKSKAHENIKLVKRFYRNARKGDYEKANDFLRSEIVYCENTVAPWFPEAHDGAAAVLQETFGPIQKTILDYRIHLKKVFAVSENVIVLGYLRGLIIETAHDLNVPVVHIWKVSDGRAVRFQAIHDVDACAEAVPESESIAA